MDAPSSVVGPQRTGARRLAGLLPADVRVHGCRRGAEDLRRAVLCAVPALPVPRQPTPARGGATVRHLDTLAWPRPLNVDRAQRGAGGVGWRARLRGVLPAQGERDHRAYGDRLGRRRDPDGIVVATMQADAFCQAMVRSLVGALLTVGEGRRCRWTAGLPVGRRERASEVVVGPPLDSPSSKSDTPTRPRSFRPSRAALTRNRRIGPVVNLGVSGV